MYYVRRLVIKNVNNSTTFQNIDFKGVTELGNLSENLQHLTIRAGIQGLKFKSKFLALMPRIT